jgi:polysaccharide pyruvyl transferase WcaK-like protein
MKKIFIISKNKTTNLGNVALTSELIKLYEARRRKDESFIFAGRPDGLNLVNYEKFMASRDHMKLFQTWVDKVLSARRGEPVWNEGSSKQDVTYVTHVTRLNKSPRVSRLKLFAKRLLMRDVSAQYVQRLSIASAADLVLYSGAGEVGDDVVLLRQLVELAVLQSTGVKTCAINQSINIRNEKMMQVCGSVYSKMECVVVRGTRSKAKLEEMGVRSERIFVCPDTAILTKPAKPQTPKNCVGINFTPFTRFSVDVMRDAIALLKGLNYEVLFVTNDRHADQKIIEFFKNEFGIEATGGAGDHKSFSDLLSGFKFIISSRLHTNVIALSAGVPVVPIEGHFYKTMEMFDLFQYPLPVIDKNIEGWELKIVNHVHLMEQNYDQYRRLIKENLGHWQEMAKGNHSIVLENVKL